MQQFYCLVGYSGFFHATLLFLQARIVTMAHILVIGGNLQAQEKTPIERGNFCTEANGSINQDLLFIQAWRILVTPSQMFTMGMVIHQ